ncbi:MAG: XRE family transcriptional regulator [Phycisphaerales bacterium]|nr:XRE family transcriptional regulator [Phycisphaerales bacterium]
MPQLTTPSVEAGSTLGDRLRSARIAAGLSTRVLAERLAPRLKLSHATLANYERSATSPSLEVVALIAAELDRPLEWFLHTGKMLRNVRYRHRKSLVTQTAQVQFEFAAQTWLDAYLYVEGKAREPLSKVAKKRVEDIEGKTPEQRAKSTRRLCELSEEEPVISVPRVMERFGVRVIEVDTQEAIDGLAGLFGDEPVVALARGLDGDRGRINAAHELGHVVAGDVHDEVESPEAHVNAFEFASHLLMPTTVLKRAIERKSMVHLVEVKKQYGISLAAMVFRAQKLGYLSDAEAKAIWIEFAKRGWKQREPGRVAPDRALRFEILFERAIALGQVTVEEVSVRSGVSVTDLKKRLAEPIGFVDEPAPQAGKVEPHGLRLVRQA